MGALAGHAFTKMNGLGNEIVVVDMRAKPAGITAEEARAAARVLAFDQMMVLVPGQAGSDAAVQIYNRDGSDAATCGNGLRCVTALLCRDTGKQAVTLETAAGVLECWKVAPQKFAVDMGAPRLRWDEIPLAEACEDTRAIELEIEGIGHPSLRSPSVVNMGNPHAIFWVDDVAFYDLGRIGPMLERHPIFPERANISLAHVTSRDHVEVRTWERGAGLTRACGSAACAVAVAAARTGRSGRRLRVTLPGGDIEIAWRESDDHVLMTGPAELEFEGRFDPSLGVDRAAALPRA